MAWETTNEAVEVTAPATAQAAARTTALASTTAPRAGTATVVVRISPLLYSLTMVAAPAPAATTIRIMQLANGKASLSEKLWVSCSAGL